MIPMVGTSMILLLRSPRLNQFLPIDRTQMPSPTPTLLARSLHHEAGLCPIGEEVRARGAEVMALLTYARAIFPWDRNKIPISTSGLHSAGTWMSFAP